MSEFSDLLSVLFSKLKRILIWGDINIHTDHKDCVMAKNSMSLLRCFNLIQFVKCSTHSKFHTLDLVIANDSIVSQFSSADVGLSENLGFFFFYLELSRSNALSSHTVIVHKWKSVDISYLGSLFSTLLEDKVLLLYNALASKLDSFSPFLCHFSPWYNNNLCLKKAACHKME